MTAYQDISNQKENFIYVHNTSVSGQNLFLDLKDYQIFKEYLRTYLTQDADDTKSRKHFTVRGKTYMGKPHLPKNYLGSIDLVAYKLLENSFHLILIEKEVGAVEKFMRSLSTRYAIYFNKKYQRKGSIFEGPYKFKRLEDLNSLLYLTQDLHSGKNKDNSSYYDYVAEGASQWVRREIVLNHFENLKKTNTLKSPSYTDFVEQDTQNTINENLTDTSDQIRHSQSTTQVSAPNFVVLDIPPLPPARPAFIQLLIVSAAFPVLFTLGLINVKSTAAEVKLPVESANILGTDVVQTDNGPPAPTETVAITPTSIANNLNSEINQEILGSIIVTINDKSPTVKIRRDATLASDVVTEAKDGDVFKYISRKNGWYEVLLGDNTTGYVSPKYTKEDK